MVATGARNGVVELWDLDTGTAHMLRGNEDAVWDVAFDPQGTKLASASLDRTARVWDVATGTETFVLRGHQSHVTGVDFEPDGRRLVTVSSDTNLRLWDLSTGNLDTILAGHAATIWMVTRSPDGHTLATASDDHTARLWPSDDPSEAIVLGGHTMPVWSVAFDATGERVVTASYDNTARVWTREGQLITTLTGHAEGLWSAQFSRRDQVITISDDNTVRIWSLDPGIRTIVLSHSDGVTGLALSSDGLRMYTASADRSAKIWRLDLLDADAERLHTRLDAVTSFCLSAQQRGRELGEDLVQAELAARRCELRFGSSPGSGQ